MKETYNSRFATISTTGLNNIYTSTSGDVIHSLFICNKLNIPTVISLAIQRGASIFFILKNYKVPKNTTYSIDKAINLIPGDSVLVSTETPNSIDVILGLLNFLKVYGEDYLSYGSNIVNSTPRLIYRCPNNIVSNIHSFYIANTDTNLISIMSLWVTDQTNQIYYLLKDAEIVPGATIVWNKPINLKANEAIYGSSVNNTASDALISMLEILTE